MFGVLKMQKFIINEKKKKVIPYAKKSKQCKQDYSLGVFWN